MANTNIIIIGAEATGKSALAAHLSDFFKVRVLPEYVRFYFDFKKKVFGQSLSVSDVDCIATGQHLTEEMYFAEKNPLSILDTNLLLTKIYAEYYYDYSPSWVESCLDTKPYHHYLFLQNDLGWFYDEQRDSPEAQFAVQTRILEELTARKADFTVITGHGAARFSAAVHAVKAFL